MYKYIFALAAVISVGSLAMRPPEADPGGRAGYRNLKVLPKDISSKDLNRIMVDEFDDGLGVSCTFCHSEDKATGKPDYASDAKPEKSLARMMIRMTMGINRRYFKEKHPVIGDPILAVSCVTCHNGKPHPDGSGQ